MPDPLTSPAAAIVVSADASPVELVRNANRAHEQHERTTKEAVLHALEAGRQLLAAKKAVGHGNFEVLLAKEWNASQRTARRYMRLAEGWSVIASKSAIVSDLTITGALKFLVKMHDEPEPPPPAPVIRPTYAPTTPPMTQEEIMASARRNMTPPGQVVPGAIPINPSPPETPVDPAQPASVSPPTAAPDLSMFPSYKQEMLREFPELIDQAKALLKEEEEEEEEEEDCEDEEDEDEGDFDENNEDDSVYDEEIAAAQDFPSNDLTDPEFLELKQERDEIAQIVTDARRRIMSLRGRLDNANERRTADGRELIQLELKF